MSNHLKAVIDQRGILIILIHKDFRPNAMKGTIPINHFKTPLKTKQVVSSTLN